MKITLESLNNVIEQQEKLTQKTKFNINFVFENGAKKNNELKTMG